MHGVDQGSGGEIEKHDREAKGPRQAKDWGQQNDGPHDGQGGPLFLLVRCFCVHGVIQQLHDNHQHGENVDKHNNTDRNYKRVDGAFHQSSVNQPAGIPGEIVALRSALTGNNREGDNKRRTHVAENEGPPQVDLHAHTVEEEDGLMKKRAAQTQHPEEHGQVAEVFQHHQRLAPGGRQIARLRRREKAAIGHQQAERNVHVGDMT